MDFGARSEAARLNRRESNFSRTDSRTSSADGRSEIPEPTIASSLRHFIFGTSLNLLLIFIPLGALSHWLDWSGNYVFAYNFLAIIPLAKLLGYATEEIALQFGDAIGGLLNATFGNAVELIIAIVAVKEGLIRVVQASLLGSILSNLLLVLGFCFFLGGLRYKEQTFNETAAQNYAGLLALSTLSLLVPAAFWMSLSDHEKAAKGVLNLSHISAIIILVVYLLYLLFQLHTHAHLYQSVPSNHIESGTHTGQDGEADDEEDEDDGEEYPTLTTGFAGFSLLVVTLLVAFHAEFLVGSIEEITKGGTLSDTFVGLILLPIVGNAAEHITAVTTAIKDKMDLAIGVALGSSMQIALLVTPVLVIVGWALGEPMTLFFQSFETAVMFISVFIVNYLIMDGKSNWLEGAMLLSTYAIIAIAFFYYPSKSEGSIGG